MSIWLERFLLAVLVVAFGATVFTNPWDLSGTQRIWLIAAVVMASIVAARAVDRFRKVMPGTRLPSSDTDPGNLARGGRGGGGNAVGSNSLVVGGRGGRGGSLGVGRGGDGGGGDAIGDRSMVIGGDGGDAGRIDGRGGAGGASPLKRLSQDTLNSWGLTGNEGHGQGGRGANSPEYDRRLRVLTHLSAAFITENPNGATTPMSGVLMPPAEWVNERLVHLRENFEVELIDNGTDFLLRPANAD